MSDNIWIAPVCRCCHMVQNLRFVLSLYWHLKWFHLQTCNMLTKNSSCLAGIYNFHCYMTVFQYLQKKPNHFSNMTEDFSLKALVWRLWDWMIRQRPKIFRQLGRRQKHWVLWMTELLDDWVIGWLSHWVTDYWHVLTCTDTYWHLMTHINTYWQTDIIKWPNWQNGRTRLLLQQKRN